MYSHAFYTNFPIVSIPFVSVHQTRSFPLPGLTIPVYQTVPRRSPPSTLPKTQPSVPPLLPFPFPQHNATQFAQDQAAVNAMTTAAQRHLALRDYDNLRDPSKLTTSPGIGLATVRSSRFGTPEINISPCLDILTSSPNGYCLQHCHPSS